MTLNGVMALILRYFTEFGCFRSALRKSSRSLSHLLLSSCLSWVRLEPPLPLRFSRPTLINAQGDSDTANQTGPSVTVGQK